MYVGVTCPECGTDLAPCALVLQPDHSVRRKLFQCGILILDSYVTTAGVDAPDLERP